MNTPEPDETQALVFILGSLVQQLDLALRHPKSLDSAPKEVHESLVEAANQLSVSVDGFGEAEADWKKFDERLMASVESNFPKLVVVARPGRFATYFVWDQRTSLKAYSDGLEPLVKESGVANGLSPDPISSWIEEAKSSGQDGNELLSGLQDIIGLTRPREA